MSLGMYSERLGLFQTETVKDIRLKFGILNGFSGSGLAVNKDIIWALGLEVKKYLLFKWKRLFVCRF